MDLSHMHMKKNAASFKWELLPDRAILLHDTKIKRGEDKHWRREVELECYLLRSGELQ